MPDMPTNIPPQVMAALQQQQQGMSGGDITSILAQLAQMSPDELSAALQQLGVNIPPEQLVNAAENWLEAAGDKQTGASTDNEAAETTPDSEAAEGEDTQEAPTPTLENAEAAAGEQPSAEGDEGEGEGDGEQLPPNAQPTGYSPQRNVPQAPPAAMPPQGAQAMPAGLPPGRMPPSALMGRQAAGGGSTMDDLISAAMMQGAAGNPNAPVPRGPSMPPTMPRSARMPMAPTSRGNVRAPSIRSKKRG